MKSSTLYSEYVSILIYIYIGIWTGNAVESRIVNKHAENGMSGQD